MSPFTKQASTSVLATPLVTRALEESRGGGWGALALGGAVKAVPFGSGDGAGVAWVLGMPGEAAELADCMQRRGGGKHRVLLRSKSFVDFFRRFLGR